METLAFTLRWGTLSCEWRSENRLQETKGKIKEASEVPISVVQVRAQLMMMKAGNRKAVVRSGWILDIF